ncbi:MAG: 4-hydroxythreonine-4-phosphate dehydrogenase PdxA [Bacteroidetes bacterium]|nr:4-hydroxythreonine-4-phosphate dehydrogenase PdxA [Bacteroidota bacterium]
MTRNFDKDYKIKLGITQGDVNGIGYEIIIKALADQRLLELCTPIIYGSSKVASFYKKMLNYNDFNLNLVKNAETAVNKRANIVNVNNDEIKIELGQSTELAGVLAAQALDMAVEDLKKEHIDVLVTAPINKSNIQSRTFNFPGHTEYLANKFNVANDLMIMVSNNIRIGVVTGHIPLKDVASKLSIDLIMSKIRIMNQSLIQDFAITKPRIAVLALNPHASDNGLLGKEEHDIIIPAVKKAMDERILAFGPYPADGFFGSENLNNFDGIIAMYHDQGLIPFKLMSFKEGVNFTAGLPIVRTSPAHGTAYEIAGKNEASPESLRQAIYLACDIFKNRLMHQELIKNPLKISNNTGREN